MKAAFGRIGIPATAALLSLIACTGGTGEGNPEIGFISVSVRAQGGQPVAKTTMASGSPALAKPAASDTLRLFDEGNTPFALHHIYSHVDRIEILRPAGTECLPADSLICTDSSVVVPGSRFIDLLESPRPTLLDSLPVPAGTYNRMKIRFGRLANAGSGVPAPYVPVIGHSILMKGTFDYNGVPDRGLTIYLDLDEAFAFENAAGLLVRTDSPYSWAGVFLAAKWLDNLKIAECLKEGKLALEPDGSLVIDSGSECNEIEDSIEENLRNSTLFHEEEEDDEEREEEHD